MSVKLVFLERDCFADRLALLFGGCPCIAARVHIRPDHVVIGSSGHPEAFENRTKLANGLVCPRYDLLCHRRALLTVAIEQLGTRLSLEHCGEFPRQVKAVLDRRVRTQPVGRRVAVGRVAHDKHAVFLHIGRVHVVHGPGIGAQKFDLQLGIAYQLPGHLRCHRLVHNGWLFVDVIAPDDQPLVPRPHHTDKAHANPTDVRARLHDPVENAGTVCDVFGKISAEDDIHRPAHTHLTLKGETAMLGNQRIAAICTDQILRAHLELAS